MLTINILKTKEQHEKNKRLLYCFQQITEKVIRKAGLSENTFVPHAICSLEL
ncbi:hypothetical protein BRYFOR_05315 [Marvinbryantia formatexigens DSM 14469]|uniref:Uncharacterized protein n=1 Tax=Marvinbryantia formatexigens DSM 14469 TaxID=478749 RepID=C6L9M5_9FIRM|nr:hypothetical protein BRYFOR_05315 [Marvinbryantia formatexigens DSM 14469]